MDRTEEQDLQELRKENARLRAFAELVHDWHSPAPRFPQHNRKIEEMFSLGDTHQADMMLQQFWEREARRALGMEGAEAVPEPGTERENG